MTTTVQAIYEAGNLRLLRPLSLSEGVQVDVIVITHPNASPESQKKKRTPAEIMAAIAAIPAEPNTDGFSGRDHDRILYGDCGTR